MKYWIDSYEEVDASFYYDVVNATFNFLIKAHISNHSSTFSCGAVPSVNSSLSLANFLTARSNLEYGPMKRRENNYFYQDFPVRIFSIDRTSKDEWSKFNKLMGNWSTGGGVRLYYESLTQSPRDITIFRVATVVHPPFVQRLSDRHDGREFEGFCFDLLDLIEENIGNTTYKFEVFEVEDGAVGTMDDNGNWNGLMGALVSGPADIAIVPMPVSADRENDIDFTVGKR
ncbi:hypothetical protein PMAYCL1PPCAC_32294, partial [Pristionchus mayeri]